MTLAKAVVTGSVYRTPEKRFTQNNIPVSSFSSPSPCQSRDVLSVTLWGLFCLTIRDCTPQPSKLMG